MSENTITERQQHWPDHINAADAREGTLVEYAKTQGLTAKGLYQWKTMLARRSVIAGKGDMPKALAQVRKGVTASKAVLVDLRLRSTLLLHSRIGPRFDC